MTTQLIDILNSSKHLQNVQQDYFSHCKIALKTAYTLQVFTIKLVIHSFVPNVFTDTSFKLKQFIKSI